MDFLLELILELFMEGSIELASDKKVPKFIRYPLGILLISFLGFIIGCMLILGVAILKESVVAGVFIILVALFLLIMAIYRFKEIYRQKKF